MMRLDKYLKLTRLIKRRGVAKVLINEDKIFVNDKPTKPAYEVKINDTIKLELGKRVILIKVKNIKEVVTKENADTLYDIIKDTLTTK
ncbi:MAG: RNA-binding S4 domain-containing protein [Bacilli bacterium]|nr:RNA-binding S4 domain-containing protein [Bacilli bacterium]